MRPIKLNIHPGFLDGYIYLGVLFLVSHNGEICSIRMDRIISKLEKVHPEHTALFRLAFLRNDWLNNEQAKHMLGGYNLYSTFADSWKLVSELNLEIYLEEEDITKHHEVPSMPIFDFKAYGMKLFMGHREGLHECHINSNEDIFK
ncbi:hypothetical protein, partial [Cesiribacter andamanensis]|uniref:hypothetical protein n=1 Tax=Cesiribacter andamanensis TaxID=649507 RepID=UPI001268FC07